jgi:hypothetical protein
MRTRSSYTRPVVELPPAPDYALKIRHTIHKGSQQRYLLTGDEHLDSHECYIKLLRQHYEEARETNSLIISNGDFLDVIASRNDPRGTKGGTIHELNRSDYLDGVVDEAFDFLEPFANHLVRFGTGNHESVVTKRYEVSLMRHLIDRLNAVRSKDIAPIHHAGYTGWIKFMFENGGNRDRSSELMKLEHGTGGNSPVTKGVISAHRRQTRTHGATFFVSSHIHERWIQNFLQERLNSSTGRVELHRSCHIQLGSYKSDFRLDGESSWFMEKIGEPKPVGGYWLTFSSNDGQRVQWSVNDVDVDYPNLQSYLRKPAGILRAS